MWILLIVAAGVGFLYLKNKGVTVASVSNAVSGSVSNAVSGSVASVESAVVVKQTADPITGIPYGTVTIGGKPADPTWQPGVSGAQKAVSLTGTAAGLTGALSGTALPGVSGIAAAGTALGTAIPIVGIGVAIASTIMSIIHSHHNAAVASEAKGLGEAEPGTFNSLVLVAQATICGEITTVAQAQAEVNQIVADYYTQVKSIIKGHWPYKGDHYPEPTFSDSWGNKWKTRPGGKLADDSPPSVCNGPCVVGHFYIERDAMVVVDTVKKILAGQHGTMVFPELVAGTADPGFPEVLMTF